MDKEPRRIFMKKEKFVIWNEGSEEWARGEYGEPYSLEQTANIVEAVRNGTMSLTEDARRALLEQMEAGERENEKRINEQTPNEEVAIWPVLTHQWLKQVWGAKLRDTTDKADKVC